MARLSGSRVAAAGFTFAAAAAQVPAQDAAPAAIADNSFLIEEAYNQEPGVVQHVSVLTRPERGGFAYAFTQEWPLGGMKRQVSYTIPVLRAEEGGFGVGDVALHFRYQLAGDGGGGLHLAPRLTLLVPTGDGRRARGAGGAGLQTNLPLSIRPLAGLALHGNAGLTWIPNATNTAGDRSRRLDAALGGSAVWLIRPAFNFLLELLWVSVEDVVGPGERVRSSGWLLNPGVRGAVNFRGGLQIVPGIGYTVGLDHPGENGLLLYLGLEHPFRRSPP